MSLLGLAGGALLGALVGCATGLLPGFHVNNVALVLLAASFGVEPTASSAFLLGVATAHTFVNIVPNTYYGAPDEDSGLVLLPAHAMLRAGRGTEAVSLSALASAVALLGSVALAVPFALLLGPPLDGYRVVQRWLPAILLGLALFLLLEDAGGPTSRTRGARRFAECVAVFLLSGALGLAALDLPVRSPLGLPSSALFPLFAGLFAVPTLLASLRGEPPRVPAEPDRGEWPRRELPRLGASCLAGTGAGALTSFLPGITGSAGTVLALALRGQTDSRHAIVALSAVNTAGLVFTMAVLAAVGRERSGVASATARLLPGLDRALAPSFVALMAAMVIAGLVAYGCTILLGRAFHRFARVPQRRLASAVLLLLLAGVIAWTGPNGLAVLVAASLVGWLPVARGLRRGHLMGCLLVPTLARLWFG